MSPSPSARSSIDRSENNMQLTGPSTHGMKMNLAVNLAMWTLVALALLAGGTKLSRAEENESVEAQKARAKRVESRASRVFYTHKFNLDDLPHYQLQLFFGQSAGRILGKGFPEIPTQHQVRFPSEDQRARDFRTQLRRVRYRP